MQAQTSLPATWVQQYGDLDEEYAFGIAVDDSANTFVTGLIGPDDTAFHRAQCANHDIFIARYNSQGTAQWLTKVGALGTDVGWGITVDKQHNIYVAANFQDKLFFSNDTVSSKGFNDALLLKYDAQGNFLWARNGGGTLDDDAYGVAVDSRNQVYITGSFVGTVFFDTISISSRGMGDAFLAKYDPNGKVLWAINAGGSAAEDAGYGLTIDRWDNLYLTGKFSDTAVFFSDTLIARGNTDIFVSKFDTAGTLQWVRPAGGASVDLGLGVRSSTGGIIYVTGDISQQAIFGVDTLVANGGTDMFVAAYDSLGTLLWTNSGGGSMIDEGSAITVGADKNIYVSGYFADTANFAGQVLYSMGGYDAYLACLDTLGNLSWIKQGGGAGMDAAGAIGADTAGSVFVAGIFDYSCTFDTITISSANDQNFFVARFGTWQITEANETFPANEELMLFPNPGAGDVCLMFAEEQNEPLRLEIFNTLGEIVFKKDVAPHTRRTDLNLQHLSSGTYLFQAQSGALVFRKKWMRE